MLRVAAGLCVALLLALVLGRYSSSTGRRAQLQAGRTAGSGPAPGSELSNVFWGVQVTDVHVSKFLDPLRVSEFEVFCTESLSVIGPALVLVTGDLTDGKTKDKLGSDQYEDEWQTYRSVLTKSHILQKTTWIDIRGNHDSFNIADLSSSNNYYRKYSGWKKEGSFHYIHHTPFGNYSFICVDATLTPGPKRPYNFFGIVNRSQMQKLSVLARESLHSNQTVWFGHYPSSTIVSSSPGIRAVMSSAVAYMCGHLHTLGGLAPVLHSQHQQGTLELELGDWMHNRRFRIFAFDHDLFSFVDLQHEEWPAILITNPKSALYSNPAVEPLQQILHSTHIRILVFSPDLITSVKVFIDGNEVGEAVHSSGPLYVLQWTAEQYQTGLHEIKVKVMSQVLFILTVLSQLILLIIFRIRRRTVLRDPPGYFTLASFSLHVLSKNNTFFYALLLLNLYTAVGPWFIGEIIDGHVGACFAFGVVVGGHFLEGSLTYVVGITQMLFFNIPLTLYLCWCLLLRCKGFGFRSHLKHSRKIVCVPIHFFMFLLLAWQIYSIFFLMLTYGTLAAFLSPMKLWLVVATLVMGRRVWVYNSAELRSYTIELKNCQST